jgi:hypothetical protein
MNRAMRFVVFGIIGGVVLGLLGFVAGFFGPILLAPQSNQGPLLGIFITGPLGFVVGIILGCLYTHFSTRRRND